MNVQAEVSLYPLRERELAPAISSFVRRLEGRGLGIEMGPMSTMIWGECGRLFDALRDAFEDAAGQSQVVLIVKISNACPAKDGGA